MNNSAICKADAAVSCLNQRALVAVLINNLKHINSMDVAMVARAAINMRIAELASAETLNDCGHEESK